MTPRLSTAVNRFLMFLALVMLALGLGSMVAQLPTPDLPTNITTAATAINGLTAFATAHILLTRGEMLPRLQTAQNALTAAQLQLPALQSCAFIDPVLYGQMLADVNNGGHIVGYLNGTGADWLPPVPVQ